MSVDPRPPDEVMGDKVEDGAGGAGVPEIRPWASMERVYDTGPDERIRSPLTACDVIPRSVLMPTWQMLLLGDASPTRVLGLLTGTKTSVDVLEVAGEVLPGAGEAAPEGLLKIDAPRVRRQVLLMNGSEASGYAVSWWNKEVMDEHLADKKKPIGASVAERRTMLHREIVAVYKVRCPDLVPQLGDPGEYWARHYFFWRDRDAGDAPLCMIMEVFSARLEAWLGPHG